MKKLSISILILSWLVLLSCESSKQAKQDPGKTQTMTQVQTDSAKAAPKMTKMSPHPMGADRGVGPVKEVKLGPIDPKMAAQGQQIFEQQCAGCHSLTHRKIGPALGEITNQHTPAFIMNMILATSKMEHEDPDIKALIARFHMDMPPQSLTEQQARDVLEYFRQAASEGK